MHLEALNTFKIGANFQNIYNIKLNIADNFSCQSLQEIRQQPQNLVQNAINKFCLYVVLRKNTGQEKVLFLLIILLFWFNNWMNTTNEFSWNNFQEGISTCFNCQHFCLLVAQMWYNIRNNDFVDKYIKAMTISEPLLVTLLTPTTCFSATFSWET